MFVAIWAKRQANGIVQDGTLVSVDLGKKDPFPCCIIPCFHSNLWHIANFHWGGYRNKAQSNTILLKQQWKMLETAGKPVSLNQLHLYFMLLRESSQHNQPLKSRYFTLLSSMVRMKIQKLETIHHQIQTLEWTSHIQEMNFLTFQSISLQPLHFILIALSLWLYSFHYILHCLFFLLHYLVYWCVIRCAWITSKTKFFHSILAHHNEPKQIKPVRTFYIYIEVWLVLQQD